MQYNPDASAASITIYHYDLSGKLIAETSEAGEAQRDYIWANQTPAAQIDHSSTANQDSVNYLHTDHLLTPRFATNGGQQVIWRWEGEAFGEAEANEDPDGDASLTRVNLRFPGQYFDGESGLHYNYFRTYDPSVGRYVQSDPIGLKGGPNIYNYSRSNSLVFFDPFGLEDIARGGGPDNNSFQPNRGPTTDSSSSRGDNGIPVATFGGVTYALGSTLSNTGFARVGAVMGAAGLGWYVGSQFYEHFQDPIQEALEDLFPYPPTPPAGQCN